MTELDSLVNGMNMHFIFYDAHGNGIFDTVRIGSGVGMPRIPDWVEKRSSAAATGAWNIWYSDIAIISADGAVTPIYTGQTTLSFQIGSNSTPMATGLSAAVVHDNTVGANALLTTSYYHGDQIGSSRLMTAGAGWPVWLGTFLPFGEEYNPQVTTNHYKFTGKERDAETNLDYFGARYYSNGLGRFITPDWAAKPITVPYAVFGDPQSLNLYSYVRNIPTTAYDPDGHCDNTFCQIAAGVAKGVGMFLWNASPGGMAISGIRQSFKDAKNPAAAHARAVGQLKAAVTVGAAVAGNPAAQAQVASGVANAWNNASTTDKASAVTQGVLALSTAAVGGLAGSAGTATETTSLFRAVGSAEGASIDATGAFSASPTGSEFKRFFFSEGDASSFASRMTDMTGDTHSVVSAEAPADLVSASPAHDAATEGQGALIHNDNLPQVKLKDPQ